LHKPTFCQQCGQKLSNKKIDHKERPYCNSCGFILFQDPKVAVVVLIQIKNKLVLVKRDINPYIGHWSFPSGYVDRSEKVENEAVREVKEETGLDVELVKLLGVYSKNDNPVILIVYTAKMTGGKLEALDEVQEVGLFPVNNLPELPFPNDHEIIADYKASL
tara:strand:+ start:206 stop:691 length:486 start_codon:yes stop_codon:yes gene_type:complete